MIDNASSFIKKWHTIRYFNDKNDNYLTFLMTKTCKILLFNLYLVYK